MTENKYDLKCEILHSIFIENDYAFYLSGKFIFHLLFQGVTMHFMAA